MIEKCNDIDLLKTLAEQLRTTLGSESPFLKEGLIGNALFFYFIYQECQEEDYREFADGLLDRLVDGLTGYLPLGFEQGLSGIGWGIEYLVQQKLVSDDSGRVLEDFDLLFRERLMLGRLDMHAVVGMGLYLAQQAQGRCDKPACRGVKRIKRNMLLCLHRLEDGWTEEVEQDTGLLLQSFCVLTDFCSFNVCRFKVIRLLDRVRTLLQMREAGMNEIERLYAARLLGNLSDSLPTMVVSDGLLYLLAGRRYCIPLLSATL